MLVQHCSGNANEITRARGTDFWDAILSVYECALYCLDRIQGVARLDVGANTEQADRVRRVTVILETLLVIIDGIPYPIQGGNNGTKRRFAEFVRQLIAVA